MRNASNEPPNRNRRHESAPFRSHGAGNASPARRHECRTYPSNSGGSSPSIQYANPGDPCRTEYSNARQADRNPSEPSTMRNHADHACLPTCPQDQPDCTCRCPYCRQTDPWHRPPRKRHRPQRSASDASTRHNEASWQRRNTRCRSDCRSRQSPRSRGHCR